MLASSARVVPDIASAACDPPTAATRNWLSTFSTVTCPDKPRLSVPSGPLIEISLLASCTSTFFGRSTGALPILDIAIPRWQSLCNDAENFTADAESARLAVGHDALRGRHNG